MQQSSRPTYANLQRALARQPDGGTDRRDHQAMIRAVREEAPRTSRPTMIYWKPLAREIHFLSQGEFYCGLLALYNKNVYSIAEQHRLHRYPAPHPLAGRTQTLGMVLKPFQGTGRVAKRLGTYMSHPRVYEELPPVIDTDGISCPGGYEEHLYPYSGDLLLFLNDPENGEPYVVNWTIKPEEDAFTDPNYYMTNKRMLNFEKRSRNLEMRHKLEEEYFKDAGIPTRRISANQINRSVLNNLRRLIYHAHDQHTLDQDSVNAIEARIRAIVDKEGIVLEKIAPICEQHGCSRQEFHTI